LLLLTYIWKERISYCSLFE